MQKKETDAKSTQDVLKLKREIAESKARYSLAAFEFRQRTMQIQAEKAERAREHVR